MFDRIALLDKIRCNELTMALGCMLLRTHQAKGRENLPQTLGQDISRLLPQSLIALQPILTLDKHVAELHHGHIGNIDPAQ